MTNQELMFNFIKQIEKENLLTDFLNNYFDYKYLKDHNYLFRAKNIDTYIIIDVYDNITTNRFNRYIFNFKNAKYTYKTEEISSVYTTYINVLKASKKGNNLLKLAYLFKLKRSRVLNYARKYLTKEFLIIFEKIII